MSARMQLCLSPAHSYSKQDKLGAWFFSESPARYCPLHQGKQRMRYVDGQWVPVEEKPRV